MAAASAGASKRTVCAEAQGEDSYYGLLGVAPDASPAQIKAAYYKLSKQWHPDKNPENMEEATAKFQKISEAYQVLSDASLRERYDKYGKEAVSETAFTDPSELFSMLFGGGRFEHLVGELQMGFFAKNAMDENSAAGMADESKQQEMDAWSKERRKKLAKELTRRLDRYVLGDERGFALEAFAERKSLGKEMMGKEMLRAIGYAYERTARMVLNSEFEGGILGSLYSTALSVEAAAHQFRSGLSAIAGTAHVAVTQSQLAKQMDTLKEEGQTEEEVRRNPEVARLTQEMEEGAIDFMWRISRLDIESTVQRVAKMVMSQRGKPQNVLKRRCEGLVILGCIFQRLPKWKHHTAADHLPAKDIQAPRPSTPTEEVLDDSASTAGVGVDLRPGDTVHICGLMRAQQYNGLSARVEQVDVGDGSGRAKVVLIDGDSAGGTPAQLVLDHSHLQPVVGI